jgi:hypothetical protein
LAKAQRVSRPDEPNLVVPLATSINERGITGFTHSITNSEDQRKLNCFYELSKNPMTGKGSLTLVVRPGVTIDAFTYGVSGQASYLVLDVTGSPAPVADFVVNISGGNIISTTSSTADTVVAAGLYLPAYIDTTSLSNVRQACLQLRKVTNAIDQRVFFKPLVGGAWTEIVDADFTTPGHVGKMEHLDGYAFILADTGLIWSSDVNSLANWTSTSFLAKQIKQDFSVGLARLANQIIAFGDNTAEMFYNAGNTTGSPLGRLPHLHQRIGLINTTIVGGTHYYATLENRIYFVGRRSGGSGGPSIGAFAYDGARFEKISTPYVDKILSEKYTALYSVNAIGFHGQSAIAFCWTAPGAATQQWLMFFPDWKEWFEWSSTVFAPVNSGTFYLGVGSNQHKLYKFASSDNWQDNGTSYQWFTQFKLPNKGTVRRFMPMYGVEADTARTTNNLTVEISTNDCVTFSTLGTIDLTQDRKILFRGGSFRTAHIRLGSTNGAETRIQNFLARID